MESALILSDLKIFLADSNTSYYTEQAAKYGDEGSFDAVKALRN